MMAGHNMESKAMIYRRSSLLASFLLSMLLGSRAWCEEKPRWAIENETLILRSADGVKQREVGLKARKQSEDQQAFPKHEIAASLSQDGKHAFVRELRTTVSDRVRSTVITGTYYDAQGRSLWQRHAVDQAWVPPDGKLVLLILNAPDGCNQIENIECAKTIVSIDENGRERLKLGPYKDAHINGLSDNVKYAGAVVRLPRSKKTKYIFFDTSSNKVGVELEVLPGAPTIQNDGTIEFIRTEYESAGKDGPARPVKSEVVKTIRIAK